MPSIKVILIVLVSLFFNTSINASPTSHEFIPCKKLAVAVLESCLESRYKACWSESKEYYDSCYTEVVKMHDPEESETRKRDEAKAMLEMEMENNVEH